MASIGHDVITRDDSASDQHVNDHYANGLHATTEQDANRDDHVRSWLDATPSSLEQTWPLEDTNHVETSSISQSSQGEPSELIRGEDPPPYTVHDPAKDYPSTYEFELDENNTANAKLYIPFYLRAWVFVVFCFLFALMLIAVEVMYQISNQNHGLGTLDSNKHYLWTYGPTLFLSIVASFWSQVEYRTKQLMPWKAMTKGPVPAEEALLLDYVSPWNVKALFSAIKSKHFGVSLAILGSILIKLAIIFSTGLLSLESQRMFEDGRLVRLEDKFCAFGSDNNSYVQPVITAIGVSQYGLSFPPGTTDVYAVQSFSPVQNVTDQSAILFAPVDVFSADLTCEMAGVSQVSNAQCDGSSSGSSCDTLSYNLTVSSATCVTNTSQVSVSMNDPSDQYYGSVSAGYCIGESINGGNNRRYTFVAGHESFSYSDGAGNASGSTAMICQPTYQVCRTPVSMFLNGTVKRVNIANTSCSTIEDVSGWDVGAAVMDSIEYASSSSLVGLGSSHPGYNGSSVKLDTFFETMNATMLPDNLTEFTNITYMGNSARNLFALIAAQTAKSRMMAPVDWQTRGTVIAYEQRLYVHEVSLRLLESIFAAMIAISLVTLLLRPSSSTPSDVSTIAGLATVLARSPRTFAALQGLGSGSRGDVVKQLTGKTCNSIIAKESDRPVFRLMTSSAGEYAGEPATSDSIKWWQPSSMTIYARVVLVVIPLAIIAALEAVYQRSHKHYGLVDVHQSTPYHYVWTYIPTLILVALQTGFQRVDFNTRVFQPFQTLRQAPSIADRTINVNYLSHVTPRCIWQASRRRHYAVLATSITMLLAPLLTVVVSGLYAPDTVEKYISSSINLNDTISNTVAWDSSGSDSPDDAIRVSTLITEANMSFPSWTHDGYVLPRLNTSGYLHDQFGGNSTANTTSVRVTMPAIYATLNCTYVAPNITLNQNDTGSSVRVQVPLGCGNECASSNTSGTTTCDTSGSNYLNVSGGITFKEGVSDYGIVYIPSSDSLEIPQHCPQLALVYGQAAVDSQSHTTYLDLGAAVCSPVVYSVSVNTTFNMPGFNIQSLDADDTTKEILAFGGTGNATLGINSWLPATNWGVNSFYGGIVPGRSGVSWDDLTGEDNFPQFSAAVDDLYSILYTQWLNLYGRTTVPASTPHLSAMVMDPTRMRLKQSAISTRILEGLLAAMVVCVVTAFFLLDTRKLLPHNPCSIGAMAVLLTESEILKTIPEGAEWYGRKEIAKKRIFSDYLWSLGWFEGLGGTKRFGIDVGSAERANDR